MQHGMPAAEWGEDMSFDLEDGVPGMSDPLVSDSDGSERSVEEQGLDGTFRSRAVLEGGSERRVTRLRVSQGVERG